MDLRETLIVVVKKVFLHDNEDREMVLYSEIYLQIIEKLRGKLLAVPSIKMAFRLIKNGSRSRLSSGRKSSFLPFFFNNGPIPQPVYRLERYLDGEKRKFTGMKNKSDVVPTWAEKRLEKPLAEQRKQKEAGWIKFKNWQYFEKKHRKTRKDE